MWDVIYPKKCVGCGRMGGYVCKSCEVGIWERQQVCPECMQVSDYGLVHKKCRESKSFEGMIIMWADEGIVQKIIRLAKKKYQFDALGDLVKYSAGKIMDREDGKCLKRFLRRIPEIVEVAETRKQILQQGFSFTRLVAGGLAKEWHLRMGKGKSSYVVVVGEGLAQVEEMKKFADQLKERGVQKTWGLILAG